MRKMIWCFAVVLVGCGGHRRHYPEFSSAPVARVITNQAAPEAGPIPARVTEVAGKLPEIGKLPPPEPSMTIDGVLRNANGALEDAYFAYDRSDLSAEALGVLRRDAELLCAVLGEFPGLKVTLEGHCDERGSAEYNLALGDRRARRAEEVLREYGVPAGAVEIVSYGKEAPQCLEATESCWQKNRRAHLSVRRQ